MGEYPHGREASEQPSFSSDDLYGDDTVVDATAGTQQSGAHPPASREAHSSPQLNDALDDESDVEMDISSSAASSPRLNSSFPPRPAPPAISIDSEKGPPLAHIPALHGALPEVSAVEDALNKRNPPSSFDTAKSPALARMTRALWYHVFSYLSPTMLCRCMAVCKVLHAALTDGKAADTVWFRSRKVFFPHLPKPLMGLSELEMLRMIGGKGCQFCSGGNGSSIATTPFNSGPGAGGQRALWPFHVRSCGGCLETRMVKDIEVIGDPSLNQLRRAVPYGYKTQDSQFIPETVRALPGGIPTQLRAAKIYYKQQLEEIKDEYGSAMELGAGAAEEWRKGLEAQGKLAMADASRWEKWEHQVRHGKDLAQVLRDYDPACFPRQRSAAPSASQSRSNAVEKTSLPVPAKGQHPLPLPVHVFPLKQTQPPQPKTHAFRSALDMAKDRKARQLDIERRCLALEPPLQSQALFHMPCFAEAMRSSSPMTDPAWESLKPSILAQREAAEFLDHQHALRLAALAAAMPVPTGPASSENRSKASKKLPDSVQAQKQVSDLRDRLAQHASNLINSQWKGGKAVTRATVPVFAVQVLEHVHEKFQEEKANGRLPGPSHAAQKALAAGAFRNSQKLTLEDMRWVYDHKVRTHTTSARLDHFLCAECSSNGNPKWFSFEGVVQHYGAKHTHAFGKGNVAVLWPTAEWPDTPPYCTDPRPWIKELASHKKLPGKGPVGPLSKVQNNGRAAAPHKPVDHGMATRSKRKYGEIDHSPERATADDGGSRAAVGPIDPVHSLGVASQRGDLVQGTLQKGRLLAFAARDADQLHNTSLNAHESSEHEYDPRRPGPLDLTRLDTDLSRQKHGRRVSQTNSASTESIQGTHDTGNALNPAMRPDFAPMPQFHFPQDPWTPTVGAPSFTLYGAPQQQPGRMPNITAILSALTNHQSNSQGVNLPASQDFAVPEKVYRPDVYSNSSIQGPNSFARQGENAPPLQSHASHDMNDLEAALLRNTQHYQQQHEPIQYAANPTMYPSRYEGAHSHIPSTYQNASMAYREMPVQYVTMPDRDRSGIGRQYLERVPMTPVSAIEPSPHVRYVDEYGREVELIPIPSSSAVHAMPTMQYLSAHAPARPQYMRASEPQLAPTNTTEPPAQYYQPMHDAPRRVYYEATQPQPQ